MKLRIKEIIDGNGKSIFIPEFFNKYEGLRILKCFSYRPDEWISYREKFHSLKEAKIFLKSLNAKTMIYEINEL